ncbi:MAG: hypothetical protein AB9869_09095 [Verrucomicrobiia bacterium]
MPDAGKHLIRYYGSYSNKSRGHEPRACHRSRLRRGLRLTHPRRKKPGKGGRLWSNRSTKPNRFCAPVRVGDEDHRLHRAASVRGHREDPPALRAVGRTRTAIGAEAGGELKPAERRAPRAKPEGRRSSRVLSIWDNISALPTVFPASPGSGFCPWRTSAVPTGKILHSARARSASGRDILLSKHSWQTTLSTARKANSYKFVRP